MDNKTPRESDQLEYSVVVPVFNSSETLAELINRIGRAFAQITTKYEIILIDDGSVDRTWDTMVRIHESDRNVKIIRLSRNFGQHNALFCGFTFCKGHYVITIDDDLQYPPEEIPKMISSMKAMNAEVVIGIPEQKQHEWFRNLGSFILSYFLSMIFSLRPRLRIGSFRILTRYVVDELIQMRTSNPGIDPMIFSFIRGDMIKNISVTHLPRVVGRTQYNFGKLISLTLNNILSYSTMPLKFISVLGILSALSSFLMLAIIIFKYFIRGIPVLGWTSIIVAILFFSGLILLSLGIVGEYLVRMIREVNNTKIYAIKSQAGF